MPTDLLELKFDPRTIEHLGIKMYSQLPYALAELVANAYDAAASHVQIKLYDDNPDNKQIIVIDDGDGMSFEEIKNKFLVIGRKRRTEDTTRENSKGRKITGKKGLGKLALFGIGKTIKIETTKQGDLRKTVFTLNWDDILNEETGKYNPYTEFITKDNIDDKGTTITLSNLTRLSNFDLEGTSMALSKLFNCQGDDFKIFISRNNSSQKLLTKEMRYDGINKEFEWNIEDIITNIDSDYRYKNEIHGKIISSKKPIKQDLRGITLYINGRLANVPSFFGHSEAGHTFSYISGWIEADFLDELSKDVISTDRQSLNWDLPETEELQKFLQKIIKYLVKDWSQKRKEAKNTINSERSGINIPEWVNKVPEEVRPKLENVIKKISDKPELDDEDFSAVVKDFYEILPPYTYYHYRWLHEQVRDASQHHYINGDFYIAFQEAMKRYKNAVKAKSGVNSTEDLDIVSSSFGKGKPLSTTAKFKIRPDGNPFSETTLSNIEEGQMHLSRGVVQGGRNVVSHEEHNDLKSTGLFTEKDCLDLLSLLSHLFKRLDESEKLS